MILRAGTTLISPGCWQWGVCKAGKAPQWNFCAAVPCVDPSPMQGECAFAAVRGDGPGVTGRACFPNGICAAVGAVTAGRMKVGRAVGISFDAVCGIRAGLRSGQFAEETREDRPAGAIPAAESGFPTESRIRAGTVKNGVGAKAHRCLRQINQRITWQIPLHGRHPVSRELLGGCNMASDMSAVNLSAFSYVSAEAGRFAEIGVFQRMDSFQ